MKSKEPKTIAACVLSGQDDCCIGEICSMFDKCYPGEKKKRDKTHSFGKKETGKG